jgi:hypothetical protein
LILFLLLQMLAAVDFHDESCFEGDEIRNVRSYRALAAEFES